ncbi:hypothetical protein R1sor_011730 [Riccia sorocarpa]|uniref:Uncharacterized protein n=1 Tax=Riccia sorocarpa TaxID=122646 RepID=A0ABD3I7V2_9MARC
MLQPEAGVDAFSHCIARAICIQPGLDGGFCVWFICRMMVSMTSDRRHHRLHEAFCGGMDFSCHSLVNHYCIQSPLIELPLSWPQPNVHLMVEVPWKCLDWRKI